MTKQKKSKEDIKEEQFEVFPDLTFIIPKRVRLYGFISVIAERNPDNIIFYMDLYGGIVLQKEKSFAIGLNNNESHPVCINVTNPKLFDRIKGDIYVKVTGFFYATHKVKFLGTGKVYNCHIAQANSVELFTLGEE